MHTARVGRFVELDVSDEDLAYQTHRCSAGGTCLVVCGGMLIVLGLGLLVLKLGGWHGMSLGTPSTHGKVSRGQEANGFEWPEVAEMSLGSASTPIQAPWSGRSPSQFVELPAKKFLPSPPPQDVARMVSSPSPPRPHTTFSPLPPVSRPPQPQSPPPPPIPPSPHPDLSPSPLPTKVQRDPNSRLTPDQCEVLLGDHGLFHSMFGSRGFKKRGPAESGCWGGDREIFFAAAFDGSRCESTDWMDGLHSFPEGSAPPLLGFDESILVFCNEKLGVQGGNNDLAAIGPRCEKASQNILRVPTFRWNMCTNVEWVLCAALKKLPGQDSRSMHFATPPGTLRVADVPASRGAWYDSASVYYLETCLLALVCSNWIELLQVDRGQPFECHLNDGHLWARLDQMLAP